jgi:hypothetical protein
LLLFPSTFLQSLIRLFGFEEHSERLSQCGYATMSLSEGLARAQFIIVPFARQLFYRRRFVQFVNVCSVENVTVFGLNLHSSSTLLSAAFVLG